MQILTAECLYSLFSVIEKLQVYLLMQYLCFCMYIHMYQITCSVVARLSNQHQGLLVQ